QGHLRPLLLGEHGLFGALALGDVGDRALVAEDGTGAIAHPARVSPDHPAPPRIGRAFSRIPSCWPSRRRMRNSASRISPSDSTRRVNSARSAGFQYSAAAEGSA